jgi:hypothetical protein
MSESGCPRIVFSERLSTGIVVHFENDVCVYFPSAFLYEQRNDRANSIFREHENHEDADAPKHDEAGDDSSL